LIFERLFGGKKREGKKGEQECPLSEPQKEKRKKEGKGAGFPFGDAQGRGGKKKNGRPERGCRRKKK